jgi:hypothetical protein
MCSLYPKSRPPGVSQIQIYIQLRWHCEPGPDDRVQLALCKSIVELGYMVWGKIGMQEMAKTPSERREPLKYWVVGVLSSHPSLCSGGGQEHWTTYMMTCLKNCKECQLSMDSLSFKENAEYEIILISWDRHLLMWTKNRWTIVHMAWAGAVWHGYGGGYLRPGEQRNSTSSF